MKKTVSIVLIIFMVLSFITVMYQVVSESGRAPETLQKQNEKVDASLLPDADVDIVYYFMTSQRCANCMNIETYTKAALDSEYAANLKNGSLIWRVIEVDNRENIHFTKKYELFTKSVVLSKIRSGKEVEWKNLDQVWPLLNDRDAFIAYVSSEIGDFIEGGG